MFRRRRPLVAHHIDFILHPSSFILLLLLLALPVQANSDLVGEQAPPLSISHWVRGNAVDIHDGQHIYVVEFWQISCGPCRQTIPHLSALQRQYAGDAVIIGISNDNANMVKDFVAVQDDMDYTVTVDAQSQTFGQYDVLWIPQAFVVRPDGAIIWQGNSMLLDDALAQIVANPINISKQPAGGWKEAGESYALEVSASGLGPLHYAWSKDGEPVGEDTPVYRIDELDTSVTGIYRCIVADERARKTAVTSDAAALEVFPTGSLPCTGHLALVLIIILVCAVAIRCRRADA